MTRQVTIAHPTAGSIVLNSGAADGNGNQWLVTKITGWDAPLDGSAVTQDRPFMDGGFLDDGYFPMRKVTLEGIAVCNQVSGLRAAKANLAAVTALMRVDGTLTVDDNPTARQMTVRRGDGFQVDIDGGLGLIFQLNFMSADAGPSGTTLGSLALPLVPTGSLTAPVTPPVTTTASGNAGTITNAGNRNAPHTVTIAAGSAQAVNPAIRNNTTGKMLALSGWTIPAGDQVVIDMLNKTIKNAGGSSLRQYLAPGSEFWLLQPGANAVAVGADSAGNGTATFSYRDAWL